MKATDAARAGIYEIVHAPTGRRYVGQSINLQQRKGEHWRALRRGRHSNQKLQRAVNKYGLESFEWRVLECVPIDGLPPECARTLLTKREQYHFDLTPAGKSLNCAPVAGSCLGVKLTEETRRKISIALRSAWSTPEGKDSILAARAEGSWRENQRAGVKALCATASWREKNLAMILATRAKESWRENQLAALRAATSTVEWKEKQRQAVRNYYASPEGIVGRAKRSEAALRRWAKHRLEKQLKSATASPTAA